MPVLILMTSFAVDLGRQRALRRDLQAAADVVSLDLVRIISDPDAAPDPALTLTTLNGSLTRNGLDTVRSEEHTSELQSLMRISYAVFCLKKKKPNRTTHTR